MATQSFPHGLRVYVALPITQHGEDLRTLGAACRRACNARVFTQLTGNPCVVIGSFRARDRQHAEQAAKRIQEVVSREFEKFFFSSGKAEIRALEYNGPNPTPDTKDYVIHSMRGPQEAIQRMVQIIQQNGGGMPVPPPGRDYSAYGHLVPNGGYPFTIIGEMQPSQAMAVHNSHCTMGQFWVRDTLGAQNVDWPKTEINSTEVDPKNLLFFPIDGSPENFFNLDLINPISFPPEQVSHSSHAHPSQNSKSCGDQFLDAVAAMLKRIAELQQTHDLLSSEGVDASQLQKDIDELKAKCAVAAADLGDALTPNPTKRRRLLPEATAKMGGSCAPQQAEQRRPYLLGDTFRREVESDLKTLSGHPNFLAIRTQVESLWSRSFGSRDEASDFLHRVYLTINGSLRGNELRHPIVLCIGQKLSAMTEEGLV